MGVCPLCGHRTVSTIDHYLPKAAFPSLVVVPYNLVPACGVCNKVKLVDAPESAEDQTLHPYYDDVTDDQWLFAKVIETSPSSIVFFVRAPADWDEVLKARVDHHFDVLELGQLYSCQAATELANIRFQLENILRSAGAEAVQGHLNEGAISRRANHINSWQTAMYQAMAESIRFCNGGFLV